MIKLSRGILAGALAAATLAATPAYAQLKNLELLVPGAPGSGHDMNVRSVQTALEMAGLATGVQVTNVPGAGGLIGFNQFVTTKNRNPYLISTTFSLLSNTIARKSAATFADITPIARLSGEYEILAVPTNSPFKTMSELVAKLKSDPGSVPIAVGSPGSIDYIFAVRIAKAVGVDPAKMNLVVIETGGEMLSQVIGGHVAAAVAGRSEFSAQIEAGKLRELGIASPERLPGLDTPTLREQGVDVVLATWRGVLGQKDITPENKAAVSKALDEMVKSQGWKDMLKKNDWLDMYMPPDEFTAWLKKEEGDLKTILIETGVLK